MSLLLAPPFFFLLGMGIARLSKSRRMWRKHNRYVVDLGGVVLFVSYMVLGSLFVDLDWVQPLVAWLPAESGTDWMVNSGVFGFPAEWPVAHEGVMFATLLCFALFPLWYAWGAVFGYWLFGRSPKQTGIFGLLR